MPGTEIWRVRTGMDWTVGDQGLAMEQGEVGECRAEMPREESALPGGLHRGPQQRLRRRGGLVGLVDSLSFNPVPGEPYFCTRAVLYQKLIVDAGAQIKTVVNPVMRREIVA